MTECPKLTDRQQRFVQEYLVDFCATLAGKRAGYSRKTAGQIGHENLKKPEIQEALGREMQSVRTKTGITVAEVIGGLHQLATNAESEAVRVGAWAHLR